MEEKYGSTRNTNLISKQWCTFEELMTLGEFGRNSALKVKREIKNKLNDIVNTINNLT